MWWSHETCCSDTTIGNERKIDKLLNHIYKKMILYVFSFFSFYQIHMDARRYLMHICIKYKILKSFLFLVLLKKLSRIAVTDYLVCVVLKSI